MALVALLSEHPRQLRAWHLSQLQAQHKQLLRYNCINQLDMAQAGSTDMHQ